MLRITSYDNNNHRKLENNPDVFHNALAGVLKGEKRFHVENGDNSFDLIYEDNDALVKADHNFPNSDFYFSEMYYPPYYKYDEKDISKINIEEIEGFDEIFFEEVNEYSLVIASLALQHTSSKVVFADEKISLFPWISNKVTYQNKPSKENVLYVQKNFYPIFVEKNHNCTTGLFHCLFLLQWLTDLPVKDIKYLSFSIRKTEGIGSILSTQDVVSQAFSKYGLQVFIEPGSTRFSNELLSKYFVFSDIPEDSDETNTVYATCFNSFVLNHLVQQYTANVSLDILRPSFLNEMKEYADQIIGDKKVLGVLLRGTDIILANYVGSYRPADIDDCISIIKDRVDKYNYDRLFLATEDSYLLERMLMEFPHKVVAISQERHNVGDFRDVKYISDLEQSIHHGSSYFESVEDTTVNYFYALYLLSRCESLISNCMNSGLKIALTFNNNKYKRVDIISDILAEEKNKQENTN